MSEETPKRTIANDLDPDDEMRAYINPMDEYVTYFLRVESGAIVDMGFTPDDFKQYFAGLPEKRRNKCQIMKPFVNAVRDALAQENWYAALARRYLRRSGRARKKGWGAIHPMVEYLPRQGSEEDGDRSNIDLNTRKQHESATQEPEEPPDLDVARHDP